MAKLPSLEQGLAKLLSQNKQLAPTLSALKKPREYAQAAADRNHSSEKTISAIRDEVLSTYDDSRVGHLLSKYVLQRDAQMAKLSGLGSEAILSLIAQGALPAEIANAIGVSYDTFTEFTRITCSEAEIREAEKLGADSLVVQGLSDLETAIDKDDVAKARALMDIKLKIAKSMNSRYIEQRPSTAVQVNNYNNQDGGEGKQVPFLQILEPREEDLPPLKPHNAKQEAATLPPEVIEGEYQLFEPLNE